MLDTPGISLTETILRPPLAEAPTAVPLFVGLTNVRPVVEPVWVHSFVHFQSVFGDPLGHPVSALSDSVNHYFDNGGGPCLVLSLGTPSPGVEWSKDASETLISYYCEQSVLEMASSHSDATLICLPDAVGAAEALGDIAYLQRVWIAWMASISSHRNKFLLLDGPRSLDDADRMRENANRQGISNAAVYWPHLITDYPPRANGSDVVVPPCGCVAAAIYKTDLTRGIWKAPANVRLDHVLAPETVVRGRNPLFYSDQASFNLIRTLPGQGTRIWGCRTLAEKFPWKYVQTRRLMTFVENNLSEIARFAVFETNDEITWLKLKGLSRAWLRRLWLRGALAGSTEEDAFRIALGLGESMTSDDVASGRMIARIGVALLRPAEFLEIKLTFNLSGSALSGAGTVLDEGVPE
ncbi:MAG: phage tail sheath family protein [Actinobacteria bacterium]|nr:phage tail sheath family protein [Actinomycetota bacterium]